MTPPRSATECLAAARELRHAGELLGALGWVDRAVARDPRAAEALLLQSELRRELDWMHGFLEPLEQALQIEPGRSELRVSLAREYLEYDEADAALRHVDAGLRHVAPDSPQAAELRWLGVDALIRADRAGDAIERLGEIAGPVARKARAYASAGTFERALACAEQAPQDPEARLLRARIALWSGRIEEARAHAQAAERLGGADADAAYLLAAVEIASGDVEAARPAVERALDGDPGHPEALTLAGEIAVRDGAPDAELWFARAYASSRRYLLALDLDRRSMLIRSGEKLRGFLASAGPMIALDEARRRLPEIGPMLRPEAAPENVRELLVGLLDVHERSDPLLDLRDLQRRAPDLLSSPSPQVPPNEPVLSTIEGALRQLSGNRSTMPTRLRPGDDFPTRIRVRPDPRTAAMELRQGLKVRGFDAVVTAYDALLEEYRRHPLVHTHRGEVLLWAGRYAEALDDFEAALRGSRGTLWAYVGLASAQLLLGEPRRALATFDGARWVLTAAPTAAAVQGEAWRRLGDHEQARADLTRAIRRTPGRVSAWVNLALVALETDQAPEARRALAEAVRRAPGVFRDLAAERGERLTLKRLDRAHADLEHGLAMMRGNRSSSFVTYFTVDGRAHAIQT